MGGGLLQLVAYGAQDAYLSGNPQITFWKGLYKRHTNFAMEPFRVNLTGQAAWGGKQSCTLGRHADLLYSTYLEVVLPPTASAFRWLGNGRMGYCMLKFVELEIGGQLIDRQYGEFLYLWEVLSQTTESTNKLFTMVGIDSAATTADPNACGESGRPTRPTVMYIPLNFFYTRNPSAALPLIALQYHEVKINIEWNKQEFFTTNVAQNNVATGTVPPPNQVSVYIDYIYLDVEERRRMAQESHEYLIEQVQFNENQGMTTYNNKIDLTFNHPVKELIWVTQAAWKTDCKQTPRTTNYLQPISYDDIVRDMSLQINGQDRVPTRFGDYYRTVQPFQHHSGNTLAGLYMYSFSIRPEEHQPSGTCNFSRIDSASIVLNVKGDTIINETRPYNVRVYATNYNILRIMSGMAGLAYSN